MARSSIGSWLILLALAWVCCAPAIGQLYEPVEIPTFSVPDVGGYGLNNNGQATGYAGTNQLPTGGIDAFLYDSSSGQLRDIATDAQGAALNNQGDVIGVLLNPNGGTFGTFLYLASSGKTLNLNSLLGFSPTGSSQPTFTAINDSLQISGCIIPTNPNTPTSQSFIYQYSPTKPSLTVFNPLGSTSSCASGLDAAGAVTGTAELPDGSAHAYVYNQGASVDLGQLLGTDLGNGIAVTASQGFAINDSGQVAGIWQVPSSASSSNAGDMDGFLYTPGSGIRDLGTLVPPPGGGVQTVGGMNSAGMVVGYAPGPNNTFVPFLYSNGVMKNLIDLLDTTNPLTAFISLNFIGVITINDSGCILVNGTDSRDQQHPGVSRAFLLIPKGAKNCGGPSIVVGTSPMSLSSSPAAITITPTYTGNVPGLHAANTTRLNLYIGCRDSAGQLISGCEVTAALPDDTKKYQGGHQHDNGNRPLGEIACSDSNACPNAPPPPGNGAQATEQPNNPFSKANFTTTDTSAPVHLIYVPPQTAGDVTLSITATDASISPVKLQLHVTTAGGCSDNGGLPQLCPLYGPGYFVLTGDTPTHPFNHYGTLNFTAALYVISSHWFNYIQKNSPTPTVPLAINDMSLIDGGVFDIGAQWMNPHAWHRWGDMADIGSGGGHTISYWIPIGLRPAFYAWLKTFHYPPYNEVGSCANPLGGTSGVPGPLPACWHIQPGN